MNNVLIEFNKDFSLMDIHANFSLSSYIGALENTFGTVFVSQPSIYDVEVYLDKNVFDTESRKRTFKAKLSSIFELMGARVQYVQNN